MTKRQLCECINLFMEVSKDNDCLQARCCIYRVSNKGITPCMILHLKDTLSNRVYREFKLHINSDDCIKIIHYRNDTSAILLDLVVE